jgi:hypothetical protein
LVFITSSGFSFNRNHSGIFFYGEKQENKADCNGFGNSAGINCAILLSSASGRFTYFSVIQAEAGFTFWGHQLISLFMIPSKF